MTQTQSRCRDEFVWSRIYRKPRHWNYSGLPKEDRTRNQWISCIYNTVPEQFNPNIRVCAAHFTRGQFPDPGRVAYNAGLHKDCFYKVEIFQLCKDSLRFWLNVLLFNEFATYYLSFEQCTVVLVVCHFSDHKCRHGNVKKDSISHYNQ